MFSTLVAVTLTAMSCATSRTTFHDTWKNPDAAPLDLNGKKVLAVFMSGNDTVRYPAEEAMARELSARGAEAVSAHTIFSDADLRDADAIKQQAADLGYTAAFIIRPTGTTTVYDYTPALWAGSPYRHLWGPGYWRWGWGTAFEPGYLTADKVVRAETTVYSLEADDLVFSTVSRTYDPGRTSSFISELTKDVAQRMTRDGILAASL